MKAVSLNPRRRSARILASEAVLLLPLANLLSHHPFREARRYPSPLLWAGTIHSPNSSGPDELAVSARSPPYSRNSLQSVHHQPDLVERVRQ